MTHAAMALRQAELLVRTDITAVAAATQRLFLWRNRPTIGGIAPSAHTHSLFGSLILHMRHKHEQHCASRALEQFSEPKRAHSASVPAAPTLATRALHA